MNTKEFVSSGTDLFRSLQILDELSNDDSLTQRDLSSRLGIALGLINSYIKNLTAKGYITVKSIPPKRYAYFLTPKGFTEKTRLAYYLFQDYTRIYREARNNLKNVFNELRKTGAQKILFAGADEVAEIAYITLQETDLALVGVIDLEKNGERFFDMTIGAFQEVMTLSYDCILVTTYLRREQINKELLRHGVKKKKIRIIFPV